MNARLLALLLCCGAPGVGAEVIFEFEGPCTTHLLNTDCAYFGLNHGDPVSGGFKLAAEDGSPGHISMLTKDQYTLKFTFGDQHFTEQDAVSALFFNVNLDGAGFSSIAGSFVNAAGAKLTFLTVSTVNIALDGFEADTFDGGGRWRLAEDSDLFSPVPLPSAGVLFGTALAALYMRRRARGSSRSR